MTTIVPGKTYTHRNQWIRAPGGAVAVYIPVGYSGRLGKESIFKILSNDQHISCFLRFHDGARPVARGWISKPFPLEDQQMVPVGPARTTNGAHSRRFEGGSYVAYKVEKRDASGNGISCSLAASVAHAATLTSFMGNLLGGLKLGPEVDTAAPAQTKHEPPQSAPVTTPVMGPAVRLLLSTLTAELRGKVLRREENQRDSDYSGGGFFHESKKTLFLFADGSFRYEQYSFSRVSSGGMSMPSRRDKTDLGTWKVVMFEGKPILGLLGKDGSVIEWWHPTLRGGQQNVQYLDGIRWDCHPMKD